MSRTAKVQRLQLNLFEHLACAARVIHSRSMSRYFFRKTDTWSLKSSGSRRVREWRSGMKPKVDAKASVQLCRCAKCPGSAQRDIRVPWKIRIAIRNIYCENTLQLELHFFCLFVCLQVPDRTIVDKHIHFLQWREECDWAVLGRR